MAAPITYVNAPTRGARRGGIFAVAAVEDNVDRLLMADVLSWTSDDCDFPVGVPELCFGESADPGGVKTFEGLTTAESATVFAAYAGIACWIDGDDFAGRARAKLAQGAHKIVEDHAAEWLAANAGVALPSESVATAIALADNYADDAFPGLPVIWINRGQADIALSEHAVIADGNGGLWTANGTPIIASSSIPANTVYVTGTVTVYRSVVVDAQAIDQTHNTEYAIAEQGYAIGFDCPQPGRFTVTP